MPRKLASLSLDLDNQWSYMKTHGDAGWEEFPSYLDLVVPRVLELLAELELKITFFVVGQDAALDKNRDALASLSAAGHEIGNHSFHHEPWLHRYSPEQIEEEIARAEEHISAATGQRTIGFRGPGYSYSPDLLDVLVRRGYAYDCSTFPTFIGPLARMYYFFKARLSSRQKEERELLFGSWLEGFRPLKPYHHRTPSGELLEIPVTTMPLVRAPIHLSYVLYLAQYAPRLAQAYFSAGLALCRLTGVAPSILLHPLDFLGSDDGVGLDFFPAMRMKAAGKLEVVRQALATLQRQFDVVPMREHAAALGATLPALATAS
jgi:peptidoglycan/xylan/chitin deacetylase (PgdA/CDA1 family)